LGPFLAVPPDIVIGCLEKKKYKKIVPALRKNGNLFDLLVTKYPHKSGIFRPFPQGPQIF
jgi:hypothetical protein